MTMELLLAELQIPGTIIPIVDARLDEKWDGIFHELPRSEIETVYPEEIMRREREGYCHYRAPGGESCPDVEVRIKSFLSDPMVMGKNILIVGHGRWFVLFQKIMHDLTIEEFMILRDRGIDNCSVTEYVFDALSSAPYDSFTPWKGKLPNPDTEFA